MCKRYLCRLSDYVSCTYVQPQDNNQKMMEKGEAVLYEVHIKM